MHFQVFSIIHKDDIHQILVRWVNASLELKPNVSVIDIDHMVRRLVRVLSATMF